MLPGISASHFEFSTWNIKIEADEIGCLKNLALPPSIVAPLCTSLCPIKLQWGRCYWRNTKVFSARLKLGVSGIAGTEKGVEFYILVSGGKQPLLTHGRDGGGSRVDGGGVERSRLAWSSCVMAAVQQNLPVKQVQLPSPHSVGRWRK